MQNLAQSEIETHHKIELKSSSLEMGGTKGRRCPTLSCLVEIGLKSYNIETKELVNSLKWQTFLRSIKCVCQYQPMTKVYL